MPKQSLASPTVRCALLRWPDTRGVAIVSPRPASLRIANAYDRLQRYLEATIARIGEHGVSLSGALVWGDPTDVILAESERPEVNLVALSTQGWSGLDRWTIGSVADKVMRLSR